MSRFCMEGFLFACIVWTTCQRLRRAEVLHFPQRWVPVKGVSWCLLPLANYVKHYLIPAANFWDWLLPSPTVLSASSFTMNAKINRPRWQFLTLWYQHCCQFANYWLSFHKLLHWKRERSKCISRGLKGFVHYLNKALNTKVRSLCKLSFHLVHLPNQLYNNAFSKPCCKSLIRRDFLWTTWPHWQHRFEQKSSRTFPVNKCSALHRSVKNHTSAWCSHLFHIWINNSQSKHTGNMHLIWSWKFDVWRKTKEKIF